LPSKKRSKENAPEISESILTKAGNRAQNKAGVLLLSLLPTLFRRSYSKGEAGHFYLVPQAGFALEKSCLMHMLKDSSTSFGMTREMVHVLLA